MGDLAKEHRIKHIFCSIFTLGQWNCGKLYEVDTSGITMPTVINEVGSAGLAACYGHDTDCNEWSSPLSTWSARGCIYIFRTPLKVMTGSKPTRAMLHTTQMDEDSRDGKSIEKIRALSLLEIEILQR